MLPRLLVPFRDYQKTRKDINREAAEAAENRESLVKNSVLLGVLGDLGG